MKKKKSLVSIFCAFLSSISLLHSINTMVVKHVIFLQNHLHEGCVIDKKVVTRIVILAGGGETSATTALQRLGG